MNNDIATIITRANLEPNDYPQPVLDALAFETQVTALIERVKATPPVDLTAATAKDVAKVHAAAVAHDRDRDLALRHADTLARIATERVDTAWLQSLPALTPTLADNFATAAGALHTALDTLGVGVDPKTAAHEHWNDTTAPLRGALATLNNLHAARDAIANLSGPIDTFSNEYEHDSRTLWFADRQAHAEFRRRLSGESRDDYYLVAAATPGVRITWQTSAQQLEQPIVAAITASRTAILRNATP